MSIEQTFLDQRILHTKRKIRKSFLSLLQAESFDSISVSKLAAKAKISRATFYNHYKSKEELLKELTDDIIKDFIKSYRDPYREFNRFSIAQVKPDSVKLFEHVYENAEYYKTVVNSDYLPYFQSRLIAEMKKLGMEDYTLHHPKINDELFASYQASAITGLIVDWIKGGLKYSPEYMSEQLMEIIMVSANQQLEKRGWGKIG